MLSLITSPQGDKPLQYWAMPKIPDCDRCQFYAHSCDFVCAVHPFGIDSDACLDFRPDPNVDADELWEPEGARFINGELVIEREPFYYDCSAPVSNYLTPEEKLELLDTHPLFTGRCPRCEMPYPRYEKPPVHWDCNQCGWVDDSV